MTSKTPTGKISTDGQTCGRVSKIYCIIVYVTSKLPTSKLPTGKIATYDQTRGSMSVICCITGYVASKVPTEKISTDAQTRGGVSKICCITDYVTSKIPIAKIATDTRLGEKSMLYHSLLCDIKIPTGNTTTDGQARGRVSKICYRISYTRCDIIRVMFVSDGNFIFVFCVFLLLS